MYQTGGTIKETIEHVQRHEYVLPAIQREFVWTPEQIERLFDSLMQGYPFGTFLLWHVKAENSTKYRFYDFVRDYHEKDNPHCPQLPLIRSAVTAVLDGQQRLTALNIGLCGSMSIKLPNKWWNNPDAFPMRHLHLDLLGDVEPGEEGDKYCFKFLTEDQVAGADTKSCWFRVGDILSMVSGPEMLSWLTQRVDNKTKLNKAYATLDRLHRVIHADHVVAYYEEKTQDLSTVLNIFIRLNSGGTILSYSDLLLSIAVAQWQRLDAKKEIHDLVDDLNQIGEQFAFSKDLVLKAGLVLADIGNVGFKVENFNHDNMEELEEHWPEVRQALLMTVRLVAAFGFNGQNLRASSAILPVAYYLKKRKPKDSYLSNAADAKDRERIRIWLLKSILKPSGIWGSGLDTLLTLLRDTIKEQVGDGFPVELIESNMAKKGKSLTFEEEELDDLAEVRYGEPRTFALLSLLFPFVDLQNHFHVDHIFPRAEFKKHKLKKAGFSKEQIEICFELRDGLANLQLLDGAANIEKQQSMPKRWLRAIYNDEQRRREYCDKHLLGNLPDDISAFPAFYENRRVELRNRIAKLLGRKPLEMNAAISDRKEKTSNR